MFVAPTSLVARNPDAAIAGMQQILGMNRMNRSPMSMRQASQFIMPGRNAMAMPPNGFIRRANNIRPVIGANPQTTSLAAMMPGYRQPGQRTAQKFPLAYWTPEQRQAKMLGDLSAAFPASSSWMGDSAGMGNPSGGNWGNVNQWNAQISSAINRVAQETGIRVPANIVKAVMELESGGVNVQDNDAYIGLMQVGPGSNLSVPWDHNYARTPEGNIYYGVNELANWFKAVPDNDWVNAALRYFSGYNYNNPGVSDGHYTVADYRAHIERNLAELQGSPGSAATGFGQSAFGNSMYGTTGTGSWQQGGALQTMFPGFYTGQDNFLAEWGNGLYGYGKEYGLNGTGHTGLDIGMPYGTPYYAPGPARVVCVGCYRNDHDTGGIGRVELEMPDGARVLYDHVYSGAVQVGQTVQAGQFLGTSGGMNGPHVHLEVRVPDPTTKSGWRLIDPVAYFSGKAGGTPFGGPGAQQGGWSAPQVNLPTAPRRLNPYQMAKIPSMSVAAPMMGRRPPINRAQLYAVPRLW